MMIIVNASSLMIVTEMFWGILQEGTLSFREFKSLAKTHTLKISLHDSYVWKGV